MTAWVVVPRTERLRVGPGRPGLLGVEVLSPGPGFSTVRVGLEGEEGIPLAGIIANTAELEVVPAGSAFAWLRVEAVTDTARGIAANVVARLGASGPVLAQASVIVILGPPKLWQFSAQTAALGMIPD